jgi:glutamyl/glutaminyl-tRNA synthetase
MQISFKNDIAALTKELKEVKQSAIPKATVQALNRTGRGTKTDAVREVSKRTGIKQKDVRAKIDGPSDRFKHLATIARQVAIVDSSEGRASNLINFVTASQRKPNYFNYRKTLKSGRKGKYKAKGVKARAWGKSKTYDGTFIGKGKGSGKYLVFARKGASATPLKSIAGPSVRNEFKAKPMQAKLKSLATVRFQKNMADAVRNQLRMIAKKNAAAS